MQTEVTKPLSKSDCTKMSLWQERITAAELKKRKIVLSNNPVTVDL